MLDSNGNYVVPREEMSLMWGYIKKLEADKKTDLKRIEELENLARAEARRRALVEQELREKNATIRTIVVCAVVLVGGVVVFGAVSN